MPNITDIITRVQSKLRLQSDGVAGPATWNAIAQALGIDLAPVTTIPVAALSSAAPIGDKLAAIAESQIGTQEDEKHQNAGSAILKYQQATSLAGQGWPWCAAFVDWCVEQLFNVDADLSAKIERPRTASAFGLIEWGNNQKCHVFSAGSNYEPQRGDIVVYEFSHCGIVADVDMKGRTFHAIEGNTNEAGGRDGCVVARKARNYSSVKKFIRLPA